MSSGITEKGADQRWDDLGLLLSPVRERYLLLDRRMTALGHKCKVHETFRSKERARKLARKGTGIVDSMHYYLVALDVICDDHEWECAKHGCSFYEDFGEQAERLNFCWGGRWRRRDLPHVQACSVSGQSAIRAAKDQAAREALVLAYLDRRPLAP